MDLRWAHYSVVWWDRDGNPCAGTLCSRLWVDGTGIKVGWYPLFVPTIILCTMGAHWNEAEGGSEANNRATERSITFLIEQEGSSIWITARDDVRSERKDFQSGTSQRRKISIIARERWLRWLAGSRNGEILGEGGKDEWFSRQLNYDELLPLDRQSRKNQPHNWTWGNPVMNDGHYEQ
jgi:hypothetical protein